jgi:hypothetical protein
MSFTGNIIAYLKVIKENNSLMSCDFLANCVIPLLLSVAMKYTNVF